MNEVTNKEIRMTSVEVTELINQFRKLEENKKEINHSDLMKKIRKELETLESLGFDNQGNISSVEYKDSKGENRPCFSLSRDGIIQICMSESALVRYKIVEYINNLEEELNSFKLPKTYKEALIALVEAEEFKEKQQAQIEEMQPKVIGFEQFLSAKGCQTFSEASRVIGIGRNTLFKILKEHKVLMSNNLPYQDYMGSYFEVRNSVVDKPKFQKITQQTVITTKGMDWIVKKLKEWGELK